MTAISRLLTATLFIGLLLPGGVQADFLTKQRPSIPSVKVAPETGRAIGNSARGGAGYLREQYEEPKVVRLRFWTEFTGSSGLQVALLNRTVSGEPDENRMGTTDTGEALVVPYKTYQLSLSGELICTAQSTLVVRPVYNLLSGKNGTGDPARRYAVFFWDLGNQKWQKVCNSYRPTWSDPMGQDSELQTSFLIQVRPDLGARPVVYPGQGQPGGDDQADDGWTRDEPPVNATTVIGDGDPFSFAGAADPDPAVTTLRWAVNLGRMWNGTSAGRMRLLLNRLDTNAYSPQGLLYSPRSLDTNEVLVIKDLDDTNCISQVRVPHGLVTADPLYGSALFTNTDFISTYTLVQQLTNHVDLLSGYLWTNFSAAAQQTLVSTNSTLEQLRSTLKAELNQRIEAGAIYDSSRFSGVSLTGRTRRLLLLNPSGNALGRLNRFLLEDAYASKIARLASMSFELNFFVTSQVGGMDSLGFFTNLPGAASFVTWRAHSPDGTTNQWAMQEVRNGVTNSTTLAYNSGSETWSLTNGIGAETRIETRTVAVTVNSGVTNRLENQQVSNRSGVVSERNSELYLGFPWGYELVALTNDPGGANLATQFTYCTDPNSPAYGQVTSITYPGGYWETRAYSDVDWDSWHPYGSLITVVHPWKDTPPGTATNDCLVTDYDYGSAGTPYWGPGTYEIQTWHDAAAWNEQEGPEKLRSLVRAEATVIGSDDCSDYEVITELKDLGSIYLEGELAGSGTFGPSAGRRAGQLSYKFALSSKLDSYDYEFGSWSNATRVFTPSGNPATDGQDLRQTIYHGLDAWLSLPGVDEVLSLGLSGQYIQAVGLVPLQTTKEVRILQSGNLVAKETYVYAGSSSYNLLEQIIYQRDCLGHATNTVRVDGETQSQRVIYKADWKGTAAWPTGLKLSETDELGQVTMYAYDSLKRPVKSTKLGASTSGYPAQAALTNSLSYDAAGRALTNTTAAGSLSLKAVSLYDLSGRMVTNISPEGLLTRISYANGGRQTTTTFSSGATKIVENYLDRRPKSITGTAVTNSFFDYGQTGWAVYGSAFRLLPLNVATNFLGSANSARWTAEATDARNEVIEWISPGFGSPKHNWRLLDFVAGVAPLPGGLSETSLEDPPLQCPMGWYTAYDYDYFGQKTAECRDGPDSKGYRYWDFATLSRINVFTNYYHLDDQGHWCRAREEWACRKDNDTTLTFVSRQKERLTGFAANEISEIRSFDADTNQTTVKVTIDLANKKLTTTTTTAQSSLVATQVVVNGLLQTESTPTVASLTWHYYDALGREIGTLDPLGNRTGTRFDASTGQATASTNAQGLATTMHYYPPAGTNAGLLECLIGPTGKKTCYNYDGCGRVIQTWGDVPYAEQRTYNQFGDLETLTTYRGGSNWNSSSWPSGTTGTGDVTTWHYDEPTGLLISKTDAAGQSVTWDYYLNHYPKTRIWARGVASTNIYTVNGDLASIDYSDGSSVRFTNAAYPNYNRSGRPVLIMDASGTNVLTYDHADRVVSTACLGGLLAGITVTNHFDGLYGRDWLKVSGITPALTNTFAYDSYGRLGMVACGKYSATYGYLTNSDLLQTTTCKSNAVTVLTTTRYWETGPRLRSIANTAGNGALVTSHTYQYDTLNRRTRAALEDGSQWVYAYNDRNELIDSRRNWADWEPAAGQQFGYDYDSIGNRKSASSGGDINGANLRTTSYGANSLNQYTIITNLGYADILGAALATNGVWVNGGLAERKGEHFRREIQVGNTSGPVWTNVTVASGGATNTGGVIMPDDRQTQLFDLDGNLTFDGTWSYTWDPENRLTAMWMTNVTGIAHSNRLRLDFAYDYMGRRIKKAASAWNGSTYTNRSVEYFVYDLGAWNVIAVLSSPSTVLRAFLWGQDLSGTMTEAGGVGGYLGLLEVSHPAVTNCHFATYDGNGNVTALLKASDLTTTACYEYSPYGETLRATGPMAKVNPFRFSTKFWDEESGFAYYGQRYYYPGLGKWINRDPIGEQGGNNLYEFVNNYPNGAIDALGRFTFVELLGDVAAEYGEKGLEAAKNLTLVKRVRDVVKTFDAIQSFTSGYMEAEDMLGSSDTTMLERLAALRSEQAQGLRGQRSLRRAEEATHTHHIFPQQFRKMFKAMARGDFKNIDIDAFGLSIQKRLHLKGIHGGGYNRLWGEFTKKYGKRLKKDPMFALGFGFGLMEELGFGNFSVVPY